MQRRAFLAGVGAILAAPLAAEAEQAGKTVRIGVLGVVPPAAAVPYVQALREGLREHGWEERSVVVEYVSTDGRDDRLPEVAAELTRRNVDVIIAPGDLAGLAAKQATKTIPIILAPTSDPVASGLVASLARPGGSVTGFSIMAPDVYGKRLELLRQVLPSVERVAVLRNPDFPLAETNWKQLQEAARVLSLGAAHFDVRNVKDFNDTFKRMARVRGTALVVIGDPFMFTHRGQIVDLALRNRLAGIFEWKEYVDAGGLMSYGPDLLHMYRRVAMYVDRIANGAKPGELPVEQPTKFDLVINLKTAKALGLTIPPALLLRADRVIE